MYHEIMGTEILPQYLSLKVGAYVQMDGWMGLRTNDRNEWMDGWTDG